jgi:hypothetical protein
MSSSVADRDTAVDEPGLRLLARVILGLTILGIVGNI